MPSILRPCSLENKSKIKRMSNKLPSLISEDISEFDRHITSRRGESAGSYISILGTLSLHLLETIFHKTSVPQRVTAHIKSFLSVRRLDGVKAIGCSSSANQFPIEESLACKKNTWWISSDQAPQYIQFEALVKEAVVLQSIGISIPPLPYGPLSVRTFSISYSDGGLERKGEKMVFASDDRVFETKDDGGLQIYHLDPPIIVRPWLDRGPCIRLICKSTAIPDVPCVGFYVVRFG